MISKSIKKKYAIGLPKCLPLPKKRKKIAFTEVPTFPLKKKENRKMIASFRDNILVLEVAAKIFQVIQIFCRWKLVEQIYKISQIGINLY